MTLLLLNKQRSAHKSEHTAKINAPCRSWGLAVCLVIAACWACSGKDDAEAIRALVAKGAARAEAHDISGMLDLGTDTILAMPMGLDRHAIRAVLWRTFRYYGPFDVRYPRPTVSVADNAGTAVARFPFVIVRKERVIPGLDELRDDPVAWLQKVGENADLYRLDLQLIRHDGDWRVDRATLERFTGTGFSR